MLASGSQKQCLLLCFCCILIFVSNWKWTQQLILRNKMVYNLHFSSLVPSYCINQHCACSSVHSHDMTLKFYSATASVTPCWGEWAWLCAGASWCFGIPGSKEIMQMKCIINVRPFCTTERTSSLHKKKKKKYTDQCTSCLSDQN